MPGSFTSGQTALFTAGKFYTTDLVEMDFDSSIGGTQYLATTAYDIDTETATSGGIQTYSGGGVLLSRSQLKNPAEIQRNTVTLTFSGLSSFFVNQVQNDNYYNVAVRIYKAFYGEDLQQVDDPVLFYKGEVKGANYNVGPDNAEAVYEVSHNLFNFKKKADFLTNFDSFQRYRKAVEDSGTALPWGEAVWNTFESSDDDNTIRWGTAGV